MLERLYLSVNEQKRGKKFMKIGKKSIASMSLLFMNLYLSSCKNEEVFEEKTFEINSEEVENLSINITDRHLEINESKDQNIYFSYFDSNKEKLEFNKNEESDLFEVPLSQNKKWSDFIGVKLSIDYRKVIISIPNNSLYDLSISTTNENIKINQMSFLDELSIVTNNGEIELSNVNCKKTIILDSKNGSISGSIKGSYDEYKINCSIKKGNTNLPLLKEGGEKTLRVNVNNGDINLSFVN